MTDDAVLDIDELGFDEWAATPSGNEIAPDSICREVASARFQEELSEGPTTIIISHTDADGLTSAALLAEASDLPIAIATVSYQGAYQFRDALDDILTSGIEGATLYISDFNPDETFPADDLVILSLGRGVTVRWFDHHVWDDDTLDAHRDMDIQVSVDTDECAASLIHREVEWSWSDEVSDLVTCTKDIDLWIRDDPRSPRLNEYAKLCNADNDVRGYIDTVIEHGADLPPAASKRVDESIVVNELLEDRAIGNVSRHDIGDWVVGVTYLSGGRSSEAGNRLCEEEGDFTRGVAHDDFDIAVILRPISVGIYSHSDGQGEDADPDVFSRCNEVAGKLGGGGHPTASGFGVPVDTFRDLARYWATVGQSVEKDVLGAVAQVLADATGDRGEDSHSEAGSETSSEGERG